MTEASPPLQSEHSQIQSLINNHESSGILTSGQAKEYRDLLTQDKLVLIYTGVGDRDAYFLSAQDLQQLLKTELSSDREVRLATPLRFPGLADAQGKTTLFKLARGFTPDESESTHSSPELSLYLHTLKVNLSHEPMPTLSKTSAEENRGIEEIASKENLESQAQSSSETPYEKIKNIIESGQYTLQRLPQGEVILQDGRTGEKHEITQEILQQWIQEEGENKGIEIETEMGEKKNVMLGVLLESMRKSGVLFAPETPVRETPLIDQVVSSSGQEKSVLNQAGLESLPVSNLQKMAVRLQREPLTMGIRSRFRLKGSGIQPSSERPHDTRITTTEKTSETGPNTQTRAFQHPQQTSAQATTQPSVESVAQTPGQVAPQKVVSPQSSPRDPRKGPKRYRDESPKSQKTFFSMTNALKGGAGIGGVGAGLGIPSALLWNVLMSSNANPKTATALIHTASQIAFFFIHTS